MIEVKANSNGDIFVKKEGVAGIATWHTNV
jgi:Holliday junction resolvase